jgi:putative ABC transport system substrate-binding protein
MKLRRLLPTLLTVGALTLGLTACGEKHDYTIGVAVIVAHPALQAAQDGFEDVLKEEGLDYKLIVQNAQGDMATVATIASTFAADEKIDLMLALSTPIAQALASADTQRPIIYSAVTDPVLDGLIPAWDRTGPNTTGASDGNPEAKQVEFVKEAMPEAQTIGVLYNTSESNSLIQVARYEEEAAALGVTIKAQGITSAGEIAQGLEALGNVDAILIPTDNIVVAGIETVVAFGEDKQIPVFCADNSTLESGVAATRGVNYYELGRLTGEMAVAILRDGKELKDVTPAWPTYTGYYVNLDAAARFGVTFSEEFIAGAEKPEETPEDSPEDTPEDN